MIEFKQLTLQVENKSLIEKADLILDHKSLNVLLGQNGSGKTTLLRYLVYHHLDQKKIRWIYQPQLIHLFKKTVRDNFNHKMIGIDILNKLGEGQLINQEVKTLSGGEKQIVAIARTFSYQADLYLLDEPTAHLDTEMRHKVYELLNDICIDKTILLVSHDQKQYFTTASLFTIKDKKILKSKGA